MNNCKQGEVNPYKTIGDNIKRKRMEYGYSQEWIAHKMNSSPYYYGKIERGQANPTIKVLLEIAEILHMTLGDMIGGIGGI